MRRLDAHRYENAVEAARFARADLEEVAAGLRPLAEGVPLLAVYGSALRMTDDFGDAQQALVAALEAAEPTGDEAILGDLVQRLAYAVADRSGDYGRALQLSEKAMVYHLAAADMNAAGKAFSPISAGEAALATVELVRVLVRQDRADEARDAAATMAQFIVPLEDRSEVAASAALELMKHSQASHRIPLELVERVAEVLEEERARPRGRARSKR